MEIDSDKNRWTLPAHRVRFIRRWRIWSIFAPQNVKARGAAALLAAHGDFHPGLPRELNRFLVTGVSVPRHADAGIVG
jgi:hypothetical protein